ncbi:hypothetical protein HMN09_00746700 [Mycena chlorophos]|uniref:Type 1 phosphatases regulator n=1 Tax=Mycena chlorophos TaxID=658473 RepID=A0A8H6SVL2_MYCCL|nr:hypothetical protein HMN09_00746700 [Mycena chlorophos]
MALATRRRPNTSAPGDGSRTMTITSAAPGEDDDMGDAGDGSEAGPSEVGTLRLRGIAVVHPPRRRVVWDENVVDNEGCGRKSSKICCIYHKPRNFDESSSEEDSSSSDSDADSSGDEYDARVAARRRLQQRQQERSQPHSHPHPSPDGAAVREGGDATVTQLEMPPSPNAYEKAPPSSSRKGKGRRKSG